VGARAVVGEGRLGYVGIQAAGVMSCARRQPGVQQKVRCKQVVDCPSCPEHRMAAKGRERRLRQKRVGEICQCGRPFRVRRCQMKKPAHGITCAWSAEVVI